jgi:hypothetical protein
MDKMITRRSFFWLSAAMGTAARRLRGGDPDTSRPAGLQPIGEAKGIHPGRVVWVHDPGAINWRGPGDGHWYEGVHTRQDNVDAMMAHAVCELTGQSSVGRAWDNLFRHLNHSRGKSDRGYKPGEKIVIKPNWVGMIWREGHVNPDTYTFIDRHDYMNTSPQVVIALLKQLVGDVGVRAADITVCDTLAYLVHEYHEILDRAVPGVRYEDFAGRFGRIKVRESTVPLYWSCRPQGKLPDHLPTSFAESEYLVNLAQLKAHTGAGVTLCGKNHFGSLVRWPVQRGYYDMHSRSMIKDVRQYREQVDLLGHAYLGGKTVLNLIDGLLSGKHPIDPAPRKWSSAPFNGNWTCSVFASQDPVAIDSVGLDFLRAEYPDYPRQRGVDDYLHEAALASNPPSGTYYDPDHPTPVTRLASLGVHEHWNNPEEKKYSRNQGTGKGIELVAVTTAAQKTETASTPAARGQDSRG